MNDLLKLLGNIAPAIATAVAGPAGGAVVSAIAKQFGVADNADAVTQAINADPEAALKLAQINLDEFKIEEANTVDARAMQVAAVQQSDVFSKRFTMYLTIFWSIAAVSYISVITFCVIPEKNIRFADTILGFMLGTVVATLLNFWYGSAHKVEAVKS
jgi:hypothetical protein